MSEPKTPTAVLDHVEDLDDADIDDAKLEFANRRAAQADAFQKALIDEPPNPFSYRMIIMFLCCLVSFLNSTTNGYDSTLMNGLLSNQQFLNFFGSQNVGIKAGMISGMLQIGGVCAIPFVGPNADMFGRRFGMAMGCLFIVVGTVVGATTTTNGSLNQLLGARFLTGFGVSLCTSSGPIYATEQSHPAYRGVVVGVYNCFYFTGQILGAGVVRACINKSSNTSWTIPYWGQMIFPGIILVFVFFLPESPRWLYAHGKIEQAKATIIKQHCEGNAESIWLKIQLAEYEEFLEMEGSDKRWWDYRALFRNRSSVYRLCCNLIVSVFGQWAGKLLIE